MTGIEKCKVDTYKE